MAMPTRPIVNDALWRCLCPSFRPIAATYSFAPCQRQLICPNNLTRLAYRSVSTTPRLQSYNALNAEALSHTYSSASRNGNASPKPHLRRNAKQDKPSLVHLSTLELYERLKRDAAVGRYEEVMNIIKILIKDRRERPNVRLYAGILHSFVNPEEGTAGKIRKVLDEMAEEGIDLDAGACHCVLEVRMYLLNIMRIRAN